MGEVKQGYEESFMRPSMMPERLVKSRREELRVGKKGFLDMFRFSRLIDVDVNGIAFPLS